MNNRIAGLLLSLWAALFSFLPFPLAAQTNSTAPHNDLAAEEKAACIRNLKVIYDAIQLYRLDHKELPNWLSDLVPQYISDANVLICPECKRTGEVETSALADPKLPCSYLYDFCPVPLGKNDAPGDPTKTRRDWKRQQMALVGSMVPLVRCRHHGMILNLAFDGRVYESPGSWEDLISNRVDISELSPARIFPASTGARIATTGGKPKLRYPARDPQTNPNLIDLSPYYNASLDESWHGNANNDLSSLPSGVQTFGGVSYDVRGIIQLRSRARGLGRFPVRVNHIQIHRKCARLNFLHAAGFGTADEDGTQIGTYVVHFATNNMQLEIPIVYGRDLRNWHQLRRERPSAELKVAWTGENGDSSAIRLFSTTWVNIAPGVEIDSIDFVSAMANAGPFLIAITAN